MRQLLFFAFIAATVCLPVFGQTELKTQVLDSKITAVKVFSDRALITRIGQVKLQKGEQTLVFDQLPAALDKSSVQVSGLGDALLRDVRVETVTVSQAPGDQLQTLTAHRKELEASMREKTDAIAQSQKERDFLAEIGKKVTSSQEQIGLQVLDVQKWTQVLDYYRTNLARIDLDTRTNQKALSSLQDELDQTKQKIASLGSGTSKTFDRVSFLLDADTASQAELRLNYILRGSSWTPVYDLRFDKAAKSMEIQYNAKIRQLTGEDWTNAQITLSTARPEIGGVPPGLTPWYLNFASYDNDGYYSSGASVRSAAPMNQMAPSAPSAAADESPKPPQQIRVATATVSTGTTSVTFAIEGSHTVQSDNLDHVVTIAVKSFPVTTRYSAIPKLSSFGYLKVNLVNSSEFPFLAGESHVFLDGSFIANSQMDFVAPGENFWTYLGVDEAIKVDYKQLNKETKKEGLLGDVQVVTYSNLITIKNNKTTEEEVTFWDQLPISQNKDIQVTLLDPKFTANTDNLKKNDLNFFEWRYKLKPGEEKRVAFTFSVGYPKNQVLSDLSYPDAASGNLLDMEAF